MESRSAIRSIFLLVLMFGFTDAQATGIRITNPSFENGLNGWDEAGLGAFGITTAGFDPGTTDGLSSLRIWSLTSCANQGCGFFSFSDGDYAAVSQSPDMTAVRSILFDATLAGQGDTSFQDFIRAEAYLDSNRVWSSQTVGGPYVDQVIDTRLFTGTHKLEFRLSAIGDGVDSQSDWFIVDNVRLNVVPIPAAVWLFSSALALVGYLGRRGRAA